MQSDPRMFWRKLRPVVKDRCTFSDIKDLVATAGLPVEKLHHLQQRSLPARSASKQELLDAIDGLIAEETSPDGAIENLLNALRTMKPQLFEVDAEAKISGTVSDLLAAMIGGAIQTEPKLSPSSHQFVPSQHSLEVFVSHSSKDADVAEVLIDLLRAALEVPASAIRCTSVDGYRLAAGASTDEALQREVRDCKCFIAILTADSLRSSYVLFELGARWGARQPLVPLLSKGLTTQSLERPLSSLNALSCSGSAQIHQLVQDVGRILSRTSVSPAVFDKHVQSLLSFGSPKTSSADASDADETKIVAPKALSADATALLELIRQEPESELRGVVEIMTEAIPGNTCFFPRIQYSGSPLTMRSRRFRMAVGELVYANFLFPPEPNTSSNTQTYEYQPNPPD